MKGDALPDNHHVARFVGGSLVQNGRVVGNAFLRRKTATGTEEAPSVHWLEIWGDERPRQAVEVRARSRMTPGSTAIFAVLNVSRTKNSVHESDEDHLTIGFVHDPLPSEPPRFPDDPSHALIQGLPNPDDVPRAEMIGDLISQTVIDTFPARPPK